MVVVEMSERQAAANEAANGLAEQQDMSHSDRLLDITNRIHSARNTDEILIDIKDDIIKLFEAERLTVYTGMESRRSWCPWSNQEMRSGRYVCPSPQTVLQVTLHLRDC